MGELHLPRPQTPEAIQYLARMFVERRVVSLLTISPPLWRFTFVPLQEGPWRRLTPYDFEYLMMFAILGQDFSFPRSNREVPKFVECRLWLRTDFDRALTMAVIDAKRIRDSSARHGSGSVSSA